MYLARKSIIQEMGYQYLELLLSHEAPAKKHISHFPELVDSRRSFMHWNSLNLCIASFRYPIPETDKCFFMRPLFPPNSYQVFWVAMVTLGLSFCEVI